MASIKDQGDRNTRIAAVLERDEKRQIQDMDVTDYIKVSLDDDALEAEEDDELDEAKAAEQVARANQR